MRKTPVKPLCYHGKVLQELLGNKKLLTYLLINIAVSALTTLLVIALWTQFMLGSTPSTPATTLPNSEQGALQVTAVIGAGDLENERVVIELVGSDELSLSGWSLRDEGGNRYTFPALVLHQGAQITIFTKPGEDTAGELFWGRQNSVWNSGEIATLHDPSGLEQASYEVP